MLFSLLLVFLVFGAAEARIGVALSPSGGVYSFPANGGKVQFTIFNTGDEDSIYSLSLSGEGAEFARLPTAQLAIVPGGYESIHLDIGAEVPAVAGTLYPLRISVHSESALTGATADVASQVQLTFSSEPGTKQYSVDLAKAETVSTNRESRPFYLLGLLVMLLAAFYLVKNKDVV